MKTNLSLVSIFFTLLILAGCGRYVPAVPPEMLAPEPVRNFAALAADDGILFSFQSSEKDARGKPLQSLEGYKLYRKLLTEEDMSLFKREGYELITLIEDNHLPVLQEMQDQARKEGRPTRRVVTPTELVSFSYKDSGLNPGATYAYRLIGVNQNGVEAEVERLVRVIFNGAQSEVVVVR